MRSVGQLESYGSLWFLVLYEMRWKGGTTVWDQRVADPDPGVELLVQLDNAGDGGLLGELLAPRVRACGHPNAQRSRERGWMALEETPVGRIGRVFGDDGQPPTRRTHVSRASFRGADFVW